MTRVTKDQLLDAVRRLNDLAHAKGNKYTYSLGGRYEHTTVERYRGLDYKGTLVIGTKRECLSALQNMCTILIDLSDK